MKVIKSRESQERGYAWFKIKSVLLRKKLDWLFGSLQMYTHFIFFECLGAKINPSDFLKRKINLWSTHALLIDMMHFFPKKNET